MITNWHFILITLLYLSLFALLLNVIKNKNDIISEYVKRLNYIMMALVRHKNTINELKKKLEEKK